MATESRPPVLPAWATTAAPVDVDSAPSGKINAGWVAGEAPPHNWVNFLFKNHADWIRYLDEDRPPIALANWTEHDAQSYTNNLRDVTFGIDHWVGVGNNGEIQRANSSGQTWLNKKTTTITFNGVAFGGGVFVAVGLLGQIESSTDGSTWATRTAAGAYAGEFFAITHNGDVFVAVGDGGEIQTSPDGITWTQRTAAGAFSGDFNSVASDESGNIVAVGAAGEIQSSADDGVTWAQRTAAGAYSGGFTGIVFGDGVWVVVGDSSGEIQSSPDFINWTQRSATNPPATWRALAYGVGRFVVIGDLATGETVDSLHVSEDGVVWKRVVLDMESTLFGAWGIENMVLLCGAIGKFFTSLRAF